MRWPFALCLLLLTSCVHRNRIAAGALDRMTKNGEQYVLVFGSLSTPAGTLAHPAIHFLHPASAAVPESMLQSLAITNGGRFFAVLRAPEPLTALDDFSAEVGSPETGFDKFTYVRVPEGRGATAMYMGEIGMSPAQDRMAQGQKVIVKVRDEFPEAEKELKRLYPHFQGTVAKVALLRDLHPPTKPLERVH